MPKPQLIEKLSARAMIAVVLCAAAIVLVLAACRKTDSRSTAQATRPGTTASAMAQRSANKPVVTATPAQVSDGKTPTDYPVPGAASPMPTTSGTPNPCPPPDGWVKHSVRQDETLYYYQTSTGETVDRIMEANCLTSDLLVVGREIYLPKIPPVRATFPPPPPVPPSREETPSCTSPFKCVSAELPTIVVPAGGPGGSGFTPCGGNPGDKPWLDISVKTLPIQGDRLFFFACQMPTPLVSANVTLPDKSTQEVPLVRTIPDFPTETAGKVIDFPILPSYAVKSTVREKYTMTVYGTGGSHAEQDFYIYPVSRVDRPERILVVPVLDAPGTKFDVYYVNFPMGATLNVSLYGEDTPVNSQEHPMSGRISWTVIIDKPIPGNDKLGWTMETLTSESDDPKAGYAVYYAPLGYKALFWLH
jgi:hypothetical protein